MSLRIWESIAWNFAVYVPLPQDFQPKYLVSLERASEFVPEPVTYAGPGAALRFPSDGTADVCIITSAYRETAEKSAVQFLQQMSRKYWFRMDASEASKFETSLPSDS